MMTIETEVEHDNLYRLPTEPCPRVLPSQVLALDGKQLYQGDKPLVWALENLGAGNVIVEDGRYDVGKIKKTEGGLYAARTKLGVVWSGFSEGDTCAMEDGAAIKPVTFRGMSLECRSRSAWITLDAAGPYRVSWEDCVIDGGYDHEKNKGFDSKWGFIPHRWIGAVRRSRFRRIKREHGMYPHSIQGDCQIVDSLFERCGRTGVQHAGRNTEAGFGKGVLKIVRSYFHDCGLNDGGSHITAGGTKAVILNGCRSFIGVDDDFRQEYMANHPEKKVFGTGHVVNWNDLSRQDPCELFAVHDFMAWSAPGCGQAPALSLKHSTTFQFSGNLLVQTGFNGNAVEFGGPYALDMRPGLSAEVFGKILFGQAGIAP